MITLNNLTNHLVKAIVIYNKFNTDNQILNDKFFESIHYSKLEQLLNLCPKKTIRHDLFHYFLYLVKTFKQFAKPDKPLTNGEIHQLELMLIDFYTTILLLLKAYQSQKIQISCNNQTILVPGLQRGITSGYRFCRLGELIQQLFIAPQCLDFTLAIEENVPLIKELVHTILNHSQEPLLIADLSAINQQLTQHVAADNTTIKLLENTIQQAQTQLQHVRMQNETLEAELQSANATINSQAKQILGFKNKQNELSLTNQSLQKQLTYLKTNQTVNNSTISELTHQVSQLTLANEELKASVAAKQAIIDEQSQQTQNLQWNNYRAGFPFGLCFFNQQSWIKSTPKPDVTEASHDSGCTP